MSDPTLTKTAVQISYTASDKYRMQMTLKGGKGSQVRSTGAEVPPEKALIEALRELARLTALFGFEDQALAAFNSARSAVKEWRDERAAKDQGDAAQVGGGKA